MSKSQLKLSDANVTPSKKALSLSIPLYFDDQLIAAFSTHDKPLRERTHQQE